jgi:hypothetical protein
MKNPQTTIALTFLTHIISGIGGVWDDSLDKLELEIVMARPKSIKIIINICSIKTKEKITL